MFGYACKLVLAILMLYPSVLHSYAMNLHFKGLVISGYDQTGVFGVPNRVLDGATYDANFIYDTEIGLRTPIDGLVDETSGSNPYPFGNASIEASITIFGSKRTINPTTFYSYTIQTNAIGIAQQYSYEFATQTEYKHVFSQLIFNAAYNSLHPSLENEIPAFNTNFYGNFLFFNQDQYLGVIDFSQGQLGGGTIELTRHVPEPIPMSIFLLGCFGIWYRFSNVKFANLASNDLPRGHCL